MQVADHEAMHHGAILVHVQSVEHRQPKSTDAPPDTNVANCMTGFGCIVQPGIGV